MIDICYILSFGFAARTVLHSGLVPALRSRGLSVAAVCPGAGEEGWRTVAGKLEIELYAAPKLGNWFAREYLEARRYFFENVRQNPALWARHLRNTERAAPPRGRLQCQSLLALNRVLMRARPLRQTLATVEASFLRSRAVRRLLRHLNPRLVVCTYPINALEATCLAEAKRLGIATVVQLLSWDNVTSKGRFPILPDYWLSWGPIMTSELKDCYGAGAGRVFETGVAHFDAHVNALEPLLQRRLLQDMGLEAGQPYLLFGMSSPYFAPYEIGIVEELARAVRANKFGAAVNLVVRPHPQNVTGNLADETWLPRLRALAGPRVGIAWPAVRESEMNWALDESDLPVLVNLLAGCAINLNSGSTFTIDGICHGKPVILTLFDAGHEVPWHRSARRGADFLHLRKLVNLGGFCVADSFQSLFRLVNEGLANPGSGRPAREAALRAECGRVDGISCQRIASRLASLVTDVCREQGVQPVPLSV